MDDLFGCFRGVESVEHDLYKLTSEMVEKKFNELPRINHCPSCEVHLVNVMNEFCRKCPECHRVFEYDDDQLQEVSPIKFLIAFLNPLQSGNAQNRSLMNGAALFLFETQPQLLF